MILVRKGRGKTPSGSFKHTLAWLDHDNHHLSPHARRPRGHCPPGSRGAKPSGSDRGLRCEAAPEDAPGHSFRTCRASHRVQRRPTFVAGDIVAQERLSHPQIRARKKEMPDAMVEVINRHAGRRTDNMRRTAWPPSPSIRYTWRCCTVSRVACPWAALEAHLHANFRSIGISWRMPVVPTLKPAGEWVMARNPSETPDKQPSDVGTSSGGNGFALSRDEKGEVERKRPPRVAVLHEIIRSEGEQELHRSVSALGWSSLAAGLSMGFSLLARGVLSRYVGDAPGGFLIESLGYPFGFLLVVLSRQQLFTENIMTAVLPVMTEPTRNNFVCFFRLWTVVIVGNLIGATLFAFGLLHLQQFDAATQAAFVKIGEELMSNTPWQMFTKGILAGWLISIMVWMLAATERSRFMVIVLTTYVIAIGGFTHIIVGSVEAMYLVFAGHLALVSCITHFALPTLIGNIVGGSLIFALISHAQVRSDVD